MDKSKFTAPISLSRIQITDSFWKNEMELVRTEVIPYQWAALNDSVEGAAPSYCMRNFKIAGKMNREKHQKGAAYIEPKYTFRGFEALPENPDKLEDKFYGFVFQDSDFSKWIEAVGYSLTQYPDAELEKLADSAIDIVCAAQQEDGYLDTYYIINGKDKIFTNLRDHHELYCFGHLVEGAVAYYQATGKDKLLRAAERFADCIYNHFGTDEGKCKGYPGHEIAEMALVRLYEATGDKKYLELSSFFIDQRGTKPYYFDTEGHPAENSGMDGLRYFYNQAHLPVREQTEAVGHAVRAVYLYSGMADVARLTDDESLFAACERLWDNIVNKKMYITGAIGATHMGEAFSFEYDLPNDTAYAETCASIGLIFFARRMLEIKPDAKYANVMERALYNGVLSGMALDGKSFFYVNPLEADPTACHKDERKFHVKPVRQKWFGCACCPPNIARLISSVGAYAYTENDDTLFVHLYIGGKLTKNICGQDVSVEISSQLPWEGSVEIKVRARHTKFRLALRIPDWCAAGAEDVCVDNDLCGNIRLPHGCKLENADEFNIEEKDGYIYLSKQWTGEDIIKLAFAMEAMLVGASAAVREDIGKAALIRGPIVYCLEEKDNGKNLHLLSVKAQNNFEISDAKIGDTHIKQITALGTAQIAADYTEQNFAQDISQDTAQGAAVFVAENTLSSTELYKPLAALCEKDVTLTYVPYYTWANRGENEMQVWTRVKNLSI